MEITQNVLVEKEESTIHLLGPPEVI